MAVARGPSCSAACGIFLDQGLNLCPLRQQADGFFFTEPPGKPDSLAFAGGVYA